MQAPHGDRKVEVDEDAGEDQRVTICHCLRAPRLDKGLQGNKVDINPDDASEHS